MLWTAVWLAAEGTVAAETRVDAGRKKIAQRRRAKDLRRALGGETGMEKCYSSESAGQQVSELASAHFARAIYTSDGSTR